jgi:hypothetical protein
MQYFLPSELREVPRKPIIGWLAANPGETPTAPGTRGVRDGVPRREAPWCFGCGCYRQTA